MSIYDAGTPGTRPPRRHQPKHGRRFSWDRLRDRIAREHRLIAAADPRSPRVRPTVATLIDGGAR